MAGVTGLGGVFLRASDHKALAAWYRDMLGVPVEAWNGARFNFADARSAPEHAYSVWCLFPQQTTYLGPGAPACMVNFRVDDLEALLGKLRAAGCAVDEKVHADENGKFGWVTDPEGHRVELWEPPGA
jgi:predicted enzyme related to lactoylglutathione lyase